MGVRGGRGVEADSRDLSATSLQLLDNSIERTENYIRIAANSIRSRRFGTENRDTLNVISDQLEAMHSLREQELDRYDASLDHHLSMEVDGKLTRLTPEGIRALDFQHLRLGRTRGVIE